MNVVNVVKVYYSKRTGSCFAFSCCFSPIPSQHQVFGTSLTVFWAVRRSGRIFIVRQLLARLVLRPKGRQLIWHSMGSFSSECPRHTELTPSVKIRLSLSLDTVWEYLSQSASYCAKSQGDRARRSKCVLLGGHFPLHRPLKLASDRLNIECRLGPHDGRPAKILRLGLDLRHEHRAAGEQGG